MRCLPFLGLNGALVNVAPSPRFDQRISEDIHCVSDSSVSDPDPSAFSIHPALLPEGQAP